MTNAEKQMMEDYQHDSDAFKGCLFLIFIIGGLIGGIIIGLILN